MTQRFTRGDHVRIAKDLGPGCDHFESDCDAIIVGSYADQYGGSTTDTYTVFLREHGEVSWYDDEYLTLIEAGRVDLLDAWRHERDEARRLHSDLDWVFAHGAEVLEKRGPGASIQALANGFGLTNLWGRNGEGITWFNNAMTTLALAEPFLRSGDKVGWLRFCEELRGSR